MGKLDPDSKKSGEDEAEDDLKVNDRRRFTRDGVLREELVDAESDAEGEAEGEGRQGGIASDGTTDRSGGSEAVADAPQTQPDGAGFQHRPLEEPEGVDFMMLINAMAQQAVFFLGEAPPTGAGEPEVNLEQARLQIDLLDVLRIKCRGNMTSEEEELLDRLLYRLRMLFVARSGGQGS